MYFFIIIYFLHLIAIYLISSEFRYVKYFLPIFFIVPIISYIQKKIKTNEYFIAFLKFYILISILTLITTIIHFSYVDFRNLANIYFIFAPLLMAIYFYYEYEDYKRNKLTNYLFFVFVISYLVSIFSQNKLFSLSYFFNVFATALVSSEFDTESGLAFIFGLFLIHYYQKRNITFFLISILLIILSFKRIVFLAIIVVFIYYFLRQIKIFGFKAYRKIILYSIFTLSLIFTYYLILGNFNYLIQKLTGIPANHFVMGRIEIYSAILPVLNPLSILSGLGVGSIDVILVGYFGRATNLHSDILKNFIEFGLLFYIIWIYLFIKYHTKNENLTVYGIYLSILFITDNVFMYFNVMFVFYLLISQYLKIEN